MNVLYVSTLVDSDKYKNMLENYKIDNGQQCQKFHSLLVEGLLEQKDIKLTALSIRPCNRKMTKQLVFKKETTIKKHLTCIYIPFLNLPVVRQVSIALGVYFFASGWIKKNGNKGFIICDILSQSSLIGTLLAKQQTKVIGIVSDLPTYRVSTMKNDSLIGKALKFANCINLLLSKKVDAFVLLTHEMNKVINPKNKPYEVIEGLVDIKMTQKENVLESKHKKLVCHYAGGLFKIYGIENLIKGFLKANIPQTELHFYGGGPYERTIAEIASKHKNIKFFGYVKNDIIVNEQLKSTLLINPRLTNEDYTKFSFPSKNMEYMASGTPMLTTRLPGMPKEYYPYVYILDNESDEGIKEALLAIFSLSKDELHEKGKAAKEYVLRKKNNIIQASKVTKMIKMNLQ